MESTEGHKKFIDLEKQLKVGGQERKTSTFLASTLTFKPLIRVSTIYIPVCSAVLLFLLWFNLLQVCWFLFVCFI